MPYDNIRPEILISEFLSNDINIVFFWRREYLVHIQVSCNTDLKYLSIAVNMQAILTQYV